MFSKQKLFECRDRPRRDIARILAEQISKNYVHYMQRQDGTLVSDMVGKLQGFFLIRLHIQPNLLLTKKLVVF